LYFRIPGSRVWHADAEHHLKDLYLFEDESSAEQHLDTVPHLDRTHCVLKGWKLKMAKPWNVGRESAGMNLLITKGDMNPILDCDFSK